MGLMQSNDPRAIRAQAEHAQKMYDNSISRNTRISYKYDLNKFRVMGYELPASPMDIVRYMSQVSKDYNPNTIARHLKALRFYHKINNFVDPTDDVMVRRIFKGIKNTYSKPLKKAKALTVEDMKKIDAYYNTLDTMVAQRNNTFLQIGFFGAFRRSELVNIRLDHLTFTKDGVEILIPRSKTDQEGQGQVCALPFMKGGLCPVLILKSWIETLGLKEGFLFPPLSKGDKILSVIKPINIDVLYLAIKAAALACELPEAERYSGHSLRRGFATEAAKRGASMSAIMKHGRWQDIGTVNGYIEEATKFVDNAASVLDMEYTSR